MSLERFRAAERKAEVLRDVMGETYVHFMNKERSIRPGQQDGALRRDFYSELAVEYHKLFLAAQKQVRAFGQMTQDEINAFDK